MPLTWDNQRALSYGICALTCLNLLHVSITVVHLMLAYFILYWSACFVANVIAGDTQ